MENAGPGSRGTGYGDPGYGVPGCGKHGVWKTRGVENPGCGEHGVWKTRSLVENTGSQWKTRGLSGKHGGTIISPNNEVEILLFQIAMKINRRETLFLVIKAN